MKKLLTLCAVCLLALSGCMGKKTATPAPEVTVTASSTPLTVETPAPIVTDTPAPAVTPAVPTEQPPSETPAPAETGPVTASVPLDWDGDPDSLTLNDFPTQLSSGADVADRVSALEAGETGLYLVCQLPEQDTWLYGYCDAENTQGLILRVGTLWQAFDIPFLAPQAMMPAMAYGDYDSDGMEELAVVSFLGGGSGVSVWGLSLVDFSSGAWQLFQFDPADYTAIVDLTLSSAYDPESDQITLLAGDASLSLSPADLGYPGLGAEMAAGLGHWIFFTTDGDAIEASFGISLRAEGMPDEGVHAAMLNANVVYTGSAFGLSDFSFSLPEF